MIKRILSKGEEMPLGYGIVGPSYNYYKAWEILPIPLNYLKRVWYWLLRKDADYATSVGWPEKLYDQIEEEITRRVKAQLKGKAVLTKKQLLIMVGEFVEKYSKVLDRGLDDETLQIRLHSLLDDTWEEISKDTL